jgi:hypothetical protein
MDPLEILREIAMAYQVGHTGRIRDLRRVEMITKARDACDAAGIDYTNATLVPERTDSPWNRRDGKAK